MLLIQVLLSANNKTPSFTTSKTVKGDTHISDAKMSHVNNIRLVTANSRRRHQIYKSTICLILQRTYW